jgi:hypothetical protein
MAYEVAVELSNKINVSDNSNGVFKINVEEFQQKIKNLLNLYQQLIVLVKI